MLIKCCIAHVLIFSLSFSTIGIIVNKDLYTFIKPSLSMYTNDLGALENETVWIDSTSFCETSDPAALRSVLYHLYTNHQLSGAVFIGDLPIVNFADGSYFFATDYYFMDLDGVWSGHENYNFESHSGNREMEIWISRIPVSLAASDVQEQSTIIHDYFTRVHYRMQNKNNTQKGYLIFGNSVEWPILEEENRYTLTYQENATVIYKRPFDTKPMLKKELTHGYEYVFIYEHSHATAHVLTDGLFTIDDYDSLQSYTQFYNLFACSSANYLQRNLSTVYALKQNGLVSIGSTKPGSMMPGTYTFYNGPLNQGVSFGEAFKNWSNKAGIANASWHYGMNLQGAGTLRLKKYADASVKNFKTPNSSNQVSVFPTCITHHQKPLFKTTVQSMKYNDIRLSVYSVKGLCIFSRIYHVSEFTWDVCDNSNKRVQPGVYTAIISYGPHLEFRERVALTILY